MYKPLDTEQVNPQALQAIEQLAIVERKQYKGKNRKYPANNLKREVFLILNVLRDKYDDNTLPEDERLVYEFFKLLRKKKGSNRRRPSGRSPCADFAFKALAEAIRNLSSQTK